MHANPPPNTFGPEHGQGWEDTLLPQFAALLQAAWQHRGALKILIPRDTPATLLGNIRQWISAHVVNRPLSAAEATEVATNLQRSLALLERVARTEAHRNWFARQGMKMQHNGAILVEKHVRELQSAAETVIDTIINCVPMLAVEMDGQLIPTHVNVVDALHDLGSFTHTAVIEAQTTLAQATLPNGQGIDLTLLRYLMRDLVWLMSKIAFTCAHLKEHVRHPTQPAP